MEVGQTSQKSPEADGILQSLRSLSGSKMIIDEIEVWQQNRQPEVRKLNATQLGWISGMVNY